MYDFPRRPVRRPAQPPKPGDAAFFLAAMAGLLALVGWIVGGLAGIAVAGLAAFLAVLLGPRLPAAAIMRMLGARRIQIDLWTGAAWHGIFEMVAVLAARAGMRRAPTLYWQPTTAVRAFSVGDASDPALALSEGALRALPPRELRAVLAHEVAHLAAGDTRLLLLAETLGRVAHTVALVGLLTAFLTALLTGEVVLAGPAMLTLALTPIAGRLLTLALARRREFAADAAAARLTGDPEALARALAMIEQLGRRRWGHLYAKAVQSVPPILRTHPPTEERIARLLG